MSRDHRKLHVFQDAHKLVLAIYRGTKEFPRDEWFGLRAQMRRAATSVPGNLVEGNARSTTRDYLKFLYIALGSACELLYLIELTEELGYASGKSWREIQRQADSVVRRLQRLTQTMEDLAAAEKAERMRRRKRKRENTGNGSPKR
jgi:four helix bundle protein